MVLLLVCRIGNRSPRCSCIIGHSVVLPMPSKGDSDLPSLPRHGQDETDLGSPCLGKLLFTFCSRLFSHGSRLLPRAPGGVGFDINCGVRLVRTNLTLEDVLPVKEELTQSLYDHIPVGVGSKGVLTLTAADLNDALVSPMSYAVNPF